MNLWSRKWQPTAVFLPRKFHGQGSLVSYSLWCLKESDSLSMHIYTRNEPKMGIRKNSFSSTIGKTYFSAE